MKKVLEDVFVFKCLFCGKVNFVSLFGLDGEIHCVKCTHEHSEIYVVGCESIPVTHSQRDDDW